MNVASVLRYGLILWGNSVDVEKAFRAVCLELDFWMAVATIQQVQNIAITMPVHF